LPKRGGKKGPPSSFPPSPEGQKGEVLEEGETEKPIGFNTKGHKASSRSPQKEGWAREPGEGAVDQVLP